MVRNKPQVERDYKEYHIENKFHRDGSKSRITVLIKKNITYTRLSHLENEDTAEIWLKVKLSSRKYVHML